MEKELKIEVGEDWRSEEECECIDCKRVFSFYARCVSKRCKACYERRRRRKKKVERVYGVEKDHPFLPEFEVEEGKRKRRLKRRAKTQVVVIDSELKN